MIRSLVSHSCHALKSSLQGFSQKKNLELFQLPLVFFFSYREQHLAAFKMEKILPLNSYDCPRCIQLATKSLQSGGVIALPTDTIYGIAALAQNKEAIKRIYGIKGRQLSKPIAIAVGDVQEIYRWANVTIPRTLLEHLLPGPVTVVFERTVALNPDLNPGTSLVGIRIPDCGFVRELSRTCNDPIALTSANISSHDSSLTVQEFEELWSQLDFIFDMGSLGTDALKKKGSTVVDLSKKGLYTVIREGCAFNSTISTLQRFGLKEEFKV